MTILIKLSKDGEESGPYRCSHIVKRRPEADGMTVDLFGVEPGTPASVRLPTEADAVYLMSNEPATLGETIETIRWRAPRLEVVREAVT